MNTRIEAPSPSFHAAAFERLVFELTNDRGVAGTRMPRPLLVLGFSSFIALLVCFQHRYATRWGIPTPWLFTKEGPLEQFTFAAALLSAAFMAAAGYHARKFASGAARTPVLGTYTTCAMLLFAIGMEEISWGQQLLHFDTPQSWAAINYQQETTLHNLVDKELLTSGTRYIALMFALVAAALPFFRTILGGRYWAAVAPHASLIPLAGIIAYASLRLHAELIEAFIALYLLFYSYRAMRIWIPATTPLMPLHPELLPEDGNAGYEPLRRDTSSHSTPVGVASAGGE